MRGNRKTKRQMSFVTEQAVNFAAILFMTFLMTIFNLIADSKCDNLKKSIGLKERELRQCDADYQRELARWERLNTPEQLERALRSHGKSMHYPNPSQVVRMDESGPVPGQISVAKARQRAEAAGTARAMKASGSSRAVKDGGGRKSQRRR